MRPFLLTLLLLLTGCSSGSLLGDPIQSQRAVAGAKSTDKLAQLNAQMRSGRFRIVLMYGEERMAEHVIVGTSEVGFRPYGGSRDAYVPLGEVVRIERFLSDGAGTGLLVGATPGAIAMGLGIVLYRGCDETDWSCLIPGLLIVGGGAATLGGMIAGGAVGDATTSDHYETIYERPIDPSSSEIPPDDLPTRCDPFC